MQQTAYARMERHRREMLLARHEKRPKTVIDLLRNSCRTLVSFFFTQVGVGALLIGFNVFGAFAFQALEGELGDNGIEQTAGLAQNDTLLTLWNLTSTHNVLDEAVWRRQTQMSLLKYEKILVPLIRDKGYRILNSKEKWSLPASLMYCLSIYTTIGYGYVTPRTAYGKIATIVYACLGMPLMLLYMSNVGQVLANMFKFVYFKIFRCGTVMPRHIPTLLSYEDNVQYKSTKLSGGTRKSPSIPIICCLLVVGIYVFMGGLLFAHFEGWTALEGCYFCYISLSTIGLGDMVPSGFLTEHGKNNQWIETHQIILTAYLLVGMALVAMCFNLMQEEALHNIKAFWRCIGCMGEKAMSSKDVLLSGISLDKSFNFSKIPQRLTNERSQQVNNQFFSDSSIKVV